MLGVNRQVYYRLIQTKKHNQAVSKQVIGLVNSIRIKMPKIGTRKLYFILQEELQLLNIGRDKLFRILKANHMLIKPKKSYHITTDSHHRFRKHKNHIKTLDILSPEQVRVSDITYLGNRKKPSYLALITDAYSKKIVGFNVSNSLSVTGSLAALKNRKHKQKSLIHHSDRGLQYCSNEYQKILNDNHIKPSMTQQYDPYENAIAERVNGILKQEFGIDKYNLDLDSKIKLVKNAVKIYNQDRPHLSNSMLTPNLMHLQSQLKIKTYKKKKGSNIKSLPLEY